MSKVDGQSVCNWAHCDVSATRNAAEVFMKGAQLPNPEYNHVRQKCFKARQHRLDMVRLSRSWGCLRRELLYPRPNVGQPPGRSCAESRFMNAFRVGWAVRIEGVRPSFNTIALKPAS